MRVDDRIKFNATRMKEERMKKGLKQKDVGKLIGAAVTQVSNWETGMRHPSVPTILKISEGLNIPIEELILMNEDTFGNKITTLRLWNKMTQREMASRINIPHETLNRWERDSSIPSVYMVYCIASHLNTTMDDLITNSDGEPLITRPESGNGTKAIPK